jgi:signal transduction histidine kinase
LKDIKPSSIYSEFFTNLSHEFRTPLTLILGPTQDLMEEITDDEQKIKLQGIQANASRLLLLVNQLLDLSKSESGKLTLSTNPFSINGLVFSVCESFQNFADGKSISFKTI